MKTILIAAAVAAGCGVAWGRTIPGDPPLDLTKPMHVAGSPGYFAGCRTRRGLFHQVRGACFSVPNGTPAQLVSGPDPIPDAGFGAVPFNTTTAVVRVRVRLPHYGPRDLWMYAFGLIN